MGAGVIGGSAPTLDPSFLTALAQVPPAAWSAWFADRAITGSDTAPVQRTLQTAIPLPGGAGHAALCVFEAAPAGAGATAALAQAALRRWPGAPPADARILHEHRDEVGTLHWTLASAWADPDLRAWLREALAAGAVLRADGWEWAAVPERASVIRSGAGGSRQLSARRHDIVLFEAGAVAIMYRRLTAGGPAGAGPAATSRAGASHRNRPNAPR